jgi:enamine deaminase RidA (YjgF/YER057c/UK114 family)
MTTSHKKPSNPTALSRRALVHSAVTAAAAAGVTAPASAQNAAGDKPGSNTRFIQPGGTYQTPTYTHVVEVTGPGRLIYTSGEQGRDKDGKLAPDIRGQSVQVLENIKNALAAVGATFDHVIKFNVYMLDLEKSLPVFSEIKAQYVNTSAPPASTTVQVSKLTRGALLEVEVIASLPPVA